MADLQTKLIEIDALMRRYDINTKDIDAYRATLSSTSSTPVLIYILSYLGALLTLGGLLIFLKMNWPEMSSLMRIGLTYGVGLSLYVFALQSGREMYGSKRVAKHLFPLSFLMQAGGIAVIFSELYPDTREVLNLLLIITGFMGFQIAVTYRFFSFTSVMFSLLWAGISFYQSLIFWLLHNEIVPRKLYEKILMFDVFLILGSMITIWLARLLQKSKHKSIAEFLYFISALTFLTASWEIAEGLNLFLLFAAPLFCLFLVGQLVKSHAILVIVIIGLGVYLSKVTYMYFANTPWWPLALIGIGILIVALAVMAYKRFK